MALAIPPVLQTYFDALDRRDTDTAVGCFTADAVIEDQDDSKTLRGTEEIRTWIEETNDKYQMAVALRSVAQEGEEIIVGTQVSGTFKGSPLDFQYHFVLQGGKIATVRIHL